MQEQEDDEWSTVVNVKRIKNQERLAEKRRQREEYERWKLEQERLEQGIEEDETEDTTNITMGADFDELVSQQAKKDKEVVAFCCKAWTLSLTLGEETTESHSAAAKTAGTEAWQGQA